MSPRPESSTPRSPLPSGTVTFAFTDIEGSTERWERDRDAMGDAVRRHDALVRAFVFEHDGHVFKTVGDAFYTVFRRPEDAVAASLAVQRALAAEDFSAVAGLRVRVALHTGTAEERDGDYFGPAVNRVARLLAIGHGGQVLVSGVTADLVQGLLPSQASLRDLGEHRLKDLARPEYVYQLLAPDLPADFPQLRSLNALPNNLPRMLTSFVGRDGEIAELTALLERHQLVTLVGSGGIGKTRTSLQVAANLLDGSGDGVWFVELAPLQNGDYIPMAIAEALGVTLIAEGDPLANLVRTLSSKHALLVLDNCEHLVESVARVVSALLQGCDRLKVLASSRQGLGIAGEAAYRMPSLALPSATQDGDFHAADATRYTAIALFVERARTADQRFALSDDNAPIVADICRRLDGIPLAIELAAARVKMLSPHQLRDRLDERFRVLTGGSRDVLPRQQTLRALIDWSHDLLDERERTLFRRLSIFVNGFTLDGASAVGSGDDLDELDVFDVLASLVDKSLVLAEPAGEVLRYRLLESTGAYAREKLEAAGERERSAERHLRFLYHRYTALYERIEATARQGDLDDAFAMERDDVRAALDFALHGSYVPSGAALLAATRFSTWGVGRAEAVARAESYLAALSQDEPVLSSRLWSGISHYASGTGRKTQALEAATRAVACARVGGDTRALCWALRQCASAAMRLHLFDDAQTALREAEALPEPSTAQRLLLLETRATLSNMRGDPEAAIRSYEEMLATHRSLGNARMVGIATIGLAECLHQTGKTGRAIELVRGVLAALREMGDSNTRFCATVNVVGYLTAADEFCEASAIAREVVRELAPREPTAAFVAIVLEPLALALVERGHAARAVTLEGYADAALRVHGFEREFTETTTHDRLMALLGERLSPGDLSRALAEGAALSPEAAIALALDES